MATFQDAYTRLLRTINRPSSEADVLLACKDAINDAVMQLQRDHAFAYSEALASFEYPADTLYISLGTVCDGEVRDLVSLQEVTADSPYQGKPIKIITYSQLQADRTNYYRSHNVDPTQAYQESTVGMTIEDGYRQDVIAFVMGQNIGLYPKPASAKTLLLNLHIWMHVFVDNDDTNFFLDYAMDVVQILALKKLHIFMKYDSRYAVSDKDFGDAFQSLLHWDSQVIENPKTSIA